MEIDFRAQREAEISNVKISMEGTTEQPIEIPSTRPEEKKSVEGTIDRPIEIPSSGSADKSAEGTIDKPIEVPFMESDEKGTMDQPIEIPDDSTARTETNVDAATTQGETVTSEKGKFLQVLRTEKEKLNPRCLHTIRLLEEEIERITNQEIQERITDQEMRNVPAQEMSKEIDNVQETPSDENEVVHLSEKVFFPTVEYPNHNFIVRFVGPNGTNLRNLASFTRTRVSILGKGSTGNNIREDELAKSGDPQHAHFNEQLHALVEADGPKSSAQPRLESGVNEIKKFLQEEITRLQIPPDPYESRRPFDNDPHAHVNLREKIVVPVKENQTYQFTSNLLGPRGSNLRSIATATKAKISILGKGSLRDKTKEESLSDDPNYQHLKEPLHIIFQVAGPRQQAQARLKAAMREIQVYIDEAVNPTESKPDSSFSRGGGLSGYFEETVNLTEKIVLPIDKYPVNNFIGKIVGFKGCNLRQVTKSTQTKISILGKGSIKDKAKEEELSKSDDPEHQHFKEPLHILIKAAGPKYAVQGRLNSAVAEIRRNIDEEISRIIPLNSSNSAFSQERRPFDNMENIRLSGKVYFPIDKHPSYNFIGRLLGPKGSNLKTITGNNISSTTKTKVTILGKGSTRNAEKEEELSQSDDPRNQHFKEPLHVEIEVTGPKYAAQSKLKSVTEEIEKYTDPENNELKMKQASRNTPATFSDSPNLADFPSSSNRLSDPFMSPTKDTKTDYNTNNDAPSNNFSFSKQNYSSISNSYSNDRRYTSNYDDYSYSGNNRSNYKDNNDNQQKLSTINDNYQPNLPSSSQKSTSYDNYSRNSNVANDYLNDSRGNIDGYSQQSTNNDNYSRQTINNDYSQKSSNYDWYTGRTNESNDDYMYNNKRLPVEDDYVLPREKRYKSSNDNNTFPYGTNTY